MKTHFKIFNKEKQNQNALLFFNKTKSKSFSKQNNNQNKNYKTSNSFLFFIFNFHKIKLLFILFKTKILFYQNSKQKNFSKLFQNQNFISGNFLFRALPIFSSLARENFYISGEFRFTRFTPYPTPLYSTKVYLAYPLSCFSTSQLYHPKVSNIFQFCKKFPVVRTPVLVATFTHEHMFCLHYHNLPVKFW